MKLGPYDWAWYMYTEYKGTTSVTISQILMECDNFFGDHDNMLQSIKDILCSMMISAICLFVVSRCLSYGMLWPALQLSSLLSVKSL